MILQLPLQCLNIILNSLSNNDLLSLSRTCKLFNNVILSRMYERIYYCPGYRFSNGYKIIKDEEQLKRFLLTEKSYDFEFINLSDTEEITIDGVVYDLSSLGNAKKDELYIPFQITRFPLNFNDDYLIKFNKQYKEVKRLSIVIKNDQRMEEFELILQSIDLAKIRDLELIIIDNGEELTIFKTLLLFIRHFQRLKQLSIMYFCYNSDKKNNLRIILINSILMNLINLKKISIYLDIVNLEIAQLFILFQYLNRFQGELQFNANLRNIQIDYMVLKDLNFFKNFISNSSIVILLIEELVQINENFNKILYKLNSNFKKNEFNYKLDYLGKFLYCNYFLKEKIERPRIDLFNVKYDNGKILNILNFNEKPDPDFEDNLNEITSIFS